MKIRYFVRFYAQMWDFGSAEKIRDIPDDMHYTSQVRSRCRFLSRQTIYLRDGHGSIFLHPTQPINLWTQPNPTHSANTRTQPNPPITHLREMQTPVL